MQHTKEPTLKEKFLNGLSDFIRQNRIILSILFGALIVGIITFAVISEVTKNRLSGSTRHIETVQEKYDSWLGAETEENTATLEKEILEETEAVINKYPKLYAAQRAYFIRADLFFEKENWEKAIENYKTIRLQFPQSYLAPISLVNAAAAAEESGDRAGAIEIYNDLLEQYRETFPGTAEALFSLGRLYEQNGDFLAASRTYEDLEDNFSSTNWTKLARNRIIKLKVDGKL